MSHTAFISNNVCGQNMNPVVGVSRFGVVLPDFEYVGKKNIDITCDKT